MITYFAKIFAGHETCRLLRRARMRLHHGAARARVMPLILSVMVACGMLATPAHVCAQEGAPEILSTTMAPNVLRIGDEITISITASPDVERGIVLVDFRPNIPHLMRLTLSLDGNEWTVSGQIPELDIPEGIDTFDVEISIIVFNASNARGKETITRSFERFSIPFEVAITSPTDASLTGDNAVSVSGTVTDDAATVLVNGVAATVDNGTFTVADIPVIEGDNTITASASTASGETATDSIQLERDTISPSVSIQGVSDGLFSSLDLTPEIVVNDRNPGSTIILLNDQPFASGTLLDAESAYVLSVTATDAANNATSDSVSFTLDKTAPQITLVTPQQDLQTRDILITVSGTVVDANLASLRVNGTLITVTDGTFSTSLSLNTEGANALTITATDRASLSTSITQQIFRDTSGPNLTVTQPADGLLTNQTTITVSGTIDDPTALITVNGTAATVTNGTFSASIGLAEGNNTITVTAADVLDNKTSTTLTVIRDTEPPDLTLTEPADGFRTRLANVNVTGSVAPVTAAVSVGGVAVTVDGSGLFEHAVVLASGDNTIEVAAADEAGNSTSQTVTVALDQTPPVLSVATPVDGLVTADASVTVSGSVDDPQAEITINGVAVDNNAGSFALVIPLPGSSGPVEISVLAVDDVGNSDEIRIAVVRDITPPVIQILNPIDGALLTNDVVNVFGSVDDPTATVLVNGQPASIVANRFELTGLQLAEGENTVTATAVDSLGNEADAASATVVVDTVAPAAPGLTDPPEFVSADRVTLSGVSEALATITVTGGLIPAVVVATGDGDFTVQVLLRTNTSNVLAVAATDPAGNAGNATEITVVADSVAPVVVIDVPQNDQIAQFSQIPVTGTISDTSPIVDVRVLADSVGINADNTFGGVAVVGSGMQDIEITATDAAGNIGTATVAIDNIDDNIDNEPPQIAVVSPAAGSSVPTGPITIVALIVDQSALQTVFVNGVELTPLGDFLNGPNLTVVAEAGENGEFTITATDVLGNQSMFTHGVVVDASAPAAPIVNLVTPNVITNQERVTLFGSAEAGTTLTVTGGSKDVTIAVPADGSFSVQVILNPNAVNTLILTAVDSVNQISPPTTVDVTHDDVGPTVIAVTPDDGAVEVSFDTTIALTFDEPIAPDTAGAVTLAVDAIEIAASVSLVNSDMTIEVTPDEPLTDSAVVDITVPEAVTDRAGNSVQAIFTSRFTAIDMTQPAAPVLDLLPTHVNTAAVLLTGTGEANATVHVAGGAEAAAATIDETGAFATSVTLLSNQTNTLSATVVDAVGNTSDAVSRVTIHDDIPPELLDSIPADGEIDVPISVIISLSFSEAIKSDSVSGITLTGTGATAIDIAFDADDVVQITPVGSLTGETQFTVTLPDTVTDLAGNGLVDAQSIQFSTVDDVPPDIPIVDAFIPPSPTNAPSVTAVGFATPVTTLEVVGGAETINEGIGATGEFSVEIPLTPDTENALVFTAIDGAGNRSAPTTPFVIRQDATPPTVVSSVPADGETITVNQSIFVEFSEPMAPAPFAVDPPPIQILDDLNQPVSGQLSLSATGRSVTFFPIQNLTPNREYGIIISTAAGDLAGNALENTVTINFMTTEAQSVTRPAAPVLNPAPPAFTTNVILPLTGTAAPGSALTVFGGLAPVAAAVQPDGRFSVQVQLKEQTENHLILFVTVDGVEGIVRTTTVTHRSTAPGLRILSPREDAAYHNPSVTVMGIVDDGITVGDVLVNGERAARIGNYFALQVVVDEPGPHAVTAMATVSGGTQALSDTVNYRFEPDSEGTDTKAPIVNIIFPEPGEISNQEFIELMVTVEEGGGLVGVFSNRIPPHNEVGNIFLIYHQLRNQGLNDVTVQATDTAGLTGIDVTTVFLDDIAPAAPQVNEVPALTDRRILVVTGQAEAGVGIRITGGLATAAGAADASGAFSIPVSLRPNRANTLAVTAFDTAENESAAVPLRITHDDTRPSVLSTSPGRDEIGVPVDQRITVTFSEPINPDSIIEGASVVVTNSAREVIAGNVVFSADRTQMTFVPAFKFQRADRIKVVLAAGISDDNGFALGQRFTFGFNTALFVTTLSGVVVDPDLQPLSGVRVRITGTEISRTTGTFGTFLLDDVPTGEQILSVDARPDPVTGESPTGDSRVFGLLEYAVNVVEDTDNSLGRPIFMVPTDFSTTRRIVNAGATINFSSALYDIDGFSITYEARAPRFGDGTSNGNVTATRIEPAFIPDRLPEGAIPHFMVEIGPDDLTFSPAAALTFPDVYDLEPGDEVRIFHFKYGIHNITELGTAVVGEDGMIVTDPLLTDSGFVGYVPADPSFDLSRIFLRGRVVDSFGNGLPGIFVNALAGFTVAVTDETGEYTIPMPELRLFLVRTFATVPTSLGGAGENPSLVFQSDLTELNPSGISPVPDIVVDVFFLGGNIRFVNAAGEKLPRTGLGYDNGILTAIDDGTARNATILIYRQKTSASGEPVWDDAPYSRTTSGSSALDLGFDASFAIPLVASMAGAGGTGGNAMAPEPGDVIKIVAFSQQTGYYGETDLRIPSLVDMEAGSTQLDIFTSVDLRPPLLTVDMNRVFFLNGVRRRLNIPDNGVVLTQDEYVEIKALWRTPSTIPLDRAELRMRGRLAIETLDARKDVFFPIRGGEHAHILEIREALFANRSNVLQVDTEAGLERFAVSAGGSFAQNSLIPLSIRTTAYGLGGATAPASSPDQEADINILDIVIEPTTEGDFLVSGQFLPETEILIDSDSHVTDGTGTFSLKIASVPPNGIPVSVNGSVPIQVGASLTPVITAIDPGQGSQGDIITITGMFFSPVPAQNHVSFNGAPARVLEADETVLTVEVPNEASAGDVTVTVAGRVSNAVFFDFISEGIINGSFEFADFRGFFPEGNTHIIRQHKSILPTDRTYMALLDTTDVPRDGTATISSNRFFVPASLPFMAFDFNFLGTLVFNDVSSYLEFDVITPEETVTLEVFPNGLELMPFTVVGGYDVGTGFRTVLADLSAYAGTGEPIQFRITLKGRGPLPSRISGLRVDDDNPLDMTKTPGTSLFLDNFYLTANNVLPSSIDNEALTFSDPLNNSITITAAAGATRADSRIFALGVQSGAVFTADADNGGGFTLAVPVIDGVPTTCYGLSFSTPKTTTDNTSDRQFSPTLVITLDKD